MRNARDIRDQLLGLMERVEVEMLSDANNFDNIKKAITSGYFYNTAQMQRDGSYRTVKSRQIVHMHPKSGLKEVHTFLFPSKTDSRFINLSKQVNRTLTVE